jgi:hypothetical protein
MINDMGPCQLCMNEPGHSAQIVLIDGQWRPWPLVAARNDDWPTIRCICPECDRDGFNADVPRMNDLIRSTQP